jgi:hypothetical protein
MNPTEPHTLQAENAILRSQLHDAREQAKRDSDTIARLSRHRQRDEILTSAMAEVKATCEGLSRQPITTIVRGCISELLRIN